MCFESIFRMLSTEILCTSKCIWHVVLLRVEQFVPGKNYKEKYKVDHHSNCGFSEFRVERLTFRFSFLFSVKLNTLGHSGCHESSESNLLTCHIDQITASAIAWDAAVFTKRDVSSCVPIPARNSGARFYNPSETFLLQMKKNLCDIKAAALSVIKATQSALVAQA